MKKSILLLSAILLLIAACTTTPQGCTQEARECPDGSFVGRTGDNCEFSACPSGTCPEGVDKCMDGSTIVSVSDTPAPKDVLKQEEDIVACTADVKECPDGTYVSRQAPSCEFAPCPETKEVTMTEENKENTIVKMETNKGVMKLKLYDKKAPKTVENFKKLINKGYYDGVIFHRVIKDFMIQGGDPTGTGTGGPGYTIPDEFDPSLKHSKKGILSMANAGPNTGGSQFFITLAPTPWLDGRHSIFGELIEGEDVLDKIGNAETLPGDRPKEEIKMVKVTIEE